MATLLKIIMLLLLFPAVLRAQGNTDACQLRLREALRAHHAPPDSGTAIRRIMQVTTVRRIGARLDTTVNRVERVNWNGGEMIRSEGMEVWSDENAMVMVEEKTKRLRVVDLSDKRKIIAAQKRFQGVFPDSLIGYGREFRCEEIKQKGARLLRVSFGIDTTMQGFFNAQGMTVEINAENEIVRMAILHSRESAVRSTEYVVERIDREWKDIEIGTSVLQHFVDGSGNLRPAYAGYRVARQ